MKAAGLFGTLFALFFLCTTVSASWRWPFAGEHELVRRQDNADETTSASGRTSASSRTSATRTNSDDNASSVTNSESNPSETDASSSGSRSGSGSRTTSRASNTTLVDPRLPAGGVQLVTPAATAASQYYKVGDFITFEWNYTSLSNTPAAVDVFATCALNQATYTIASNMTVGETGRVIWDTGDQAAVTAAYPVATYTLFIHDSARDPTQAASAGDLAAFNQFRFGMYTGQPYTPLNEFKCSTCNAALSLHEQQALGVIGVTAVVTILSFTWFANGAGLLG